MTLVELICKFPDDEGAEAWIAVIRWPDGPQCPRCGCANVQHPSAHKTMPYRCRGKGCRRFCSVRVGTVMQDSKFGYQEWAIAVYLFNTSLKGVSSAGVRRHDASEHFKPMARVSVASPSRHRRNSQDEQSGRNRHNSQVGRPARYTDITCIARAHSHLTPEITPSPPPDPSAAVEPNTPCPTRSPTLPKKIMRAVVNTPPKAETSGAGLPAASATATNHDRDT